MLMSLPAIAHIILFGYVLLPWLLVAFKRYRPVDGLWGSKWIGFDNFKFLFTSTSKGLTVALNTIAYNAAFIALGTIIALILAILLSEIIRSTLCKVFQTMLFIPNFLSWVVVGFAAFAFFDDRTGMLNAILINAGVDKIRWYQSPQYWPFIIVISGIWKSLGMSSLIYVSAILGIDPEIYESTKLDGASKWQQTWSITLPMIKPLIIILTLLSIGRIMYSDFGLFYQLPRLYQYPQLISTVDVLDTFVYRALMNLNQMGMATAAGLFQSMVGLVLVLVTNWVVKKIDSDQALF
ncbi:MAG: ABC transporter permease subunit [Phycisphaerae bacterium]|nr:ABC transporter permease subunit [Phycisphaerae bacterium]